MNAHLIEWSIRAALMAAATATILPALRIRSSAAQHAAWTAVLAGMLLLPAWTAWGPTLALPVLPEASVSEINLPQFAPEPVPTPTALRSEVKLAAPQPTPAWPWAQMILACYLIGVAAMLTRLAAGTLSARALVRQATADEDVFTSPDCAAPVTIGWLRPVILLPENWRSWPAAELDAVLIHEREHARRRDPLVQWLALLNRAIFWFHPLAWWLERKLAALAEDACDAAVLRSGHDPRQYSDYLIDFARAVSRAGARLPSWGTTMVGGGLAARIQRILARAPLQSVSPSRATTAALLCGAGLVTFAACSVGPAPPLSMNEMAKRDAVQRQAKAAADLVLLEEAKWLTPEQAAAKLANLQANPQDERAHFYLMRYYEFHSDLKGKIALSLWYIEHAPGGKVSPWNISPSWDRSAYDRGKQLWIANTKQPGAQANIYERAAAYLQGADKSTAEEIILAGRAAFPDDPRWARVLGTHYGMAVAGASDPRSSDYNVLHGFSSAEAQSQYAQSVRAKLERSTDAPLLAHTAQRLMMTRVDVRTPSDTFTLAKSLAARAVALDPNDQTAASIQFRVQGRQAFLRQVELRKLPAADREKLGDADRLLLVRWEMDQAWSPGGKNPNLDLAAAKARDLLRFAEPYAVFEANIVLGKVALRKGDKRAAANYLLAAADAPESATLRYNVIYMDLPRALVDWGERDAAAQFLERIAPKTDRAKQLQDWAAQLRKGENPDLFPTMIGCGQAPC